MTAAAKKVQPEAPEKLSLTEQIKECQQKKSRMQARHQEAATLTGEHQKHRDSAEAEETRLTMEHLMAPTDELAVAVKDSRIQTESLIRQYEQSMRMLRNIPTALKTIDAELRALKSKKEAVANERISKEVTQAKLDKAAHQAAQALGQLGMLLGITKRVGLNMVDPGAVAKYLERSTSGYKGLTGAAMHEARAKLETKLKLEEI